MNINNKVQLFYGDIEPGFYNSDSLAIDTEAMGLNINRDRLCAIQISDSKGKICIIKYKKDEFNSPNLSKILLNPDIKKIFHFARFDLAIIRKNLGYDIKNIFCTRIASKLVRTYTDSHSLKELCREFLNINMSKQQQSSDWGREEFTDDQINYASNDVIYLHEIYKKLKYMLIREGRLEIAEKVFEVIPTRVLLDISGWENADIFAH